MKKKNVVCSPPPSPAVTASTSKAASETNRNNPIKPFVPVYSRKHTPLPHPPFSLITRSSCPLGLLNPWIDTVSDSAPNFKLTHLPSGPHGQSPKKSPASSASSGNIPQMWLPLGMFLSLQFFSKVIFYFFLKAFLFRDLQKSITQYLKITVHKSLFPHLEDFLCTYWNF